MINPNLTNLFQRKTWKIPVWVRITTGCYIRASRWHSGKESPCQSKSCKRLSFDPWVRKIHWSRKWQPTPVFLPGKPHGQRSLEVYSPWGCKELDIIEWLNNPTIIIYLNWLICSHRKITQILCKISHTIYLYIIFHLIFL